MCPGGPRECPEATTVACRMCRTERVPDDIHAPGECMQCGSRAYDRIRCDGCGIDQLETAMDSAAGELLRRVLIIDAALDSGFHLTLSDVSPIEFDALHFLRTEREKHRNQSGEISDTRISKSALRHG